MYFAIETNTNLPVHKHKDGDSLKLYLNENSPSSQGRWKIISTAKELLSSFELHVLEEIYENLDGDIFDLSEDKNEMAAEILTALIENEDIAEPFADKYVSKNKNTNRKIELETELGITPKPSVNPNPNKVKRITVKSLIGKVLSNTNKKAREGSVIGHIQRIIDNDTDPILFEDLRETFIFETNKDEKYINGYVTGSIHDGYIQIEEDF